MASFWIQIVGTKDTGKTSLLEDLTRELAARGRSVAYVKHAHAAPSLDVEDTDTARLRAAGASTTVLATDDSTIVTRSDGGEGIEKLSFEEALPGDIVLAEGFKTSPGAKIAIAGGDLDVGSLDGIAAVVGDPPASYDGPVFASDDVAELCDLIEKLAALPEGQQWATRLRVDGREVPLNFFVQDVIASGLAGMAESLRDVDGSETLEIRCRRIRKRR